MALVEFKKKKNPKNKIIIGITIFISLLLIIGLTRTIFGLAYRTTTAKPHLLLDKIDGTGLVIKSEKVYNSSSSGTVKYIEDEGEKVAVGKEIVKVSTTNEDILTQLDNVEKQIEELGIKYYSEEENSNLLEDIQSKINEGNYNDINDFLEDKIKSKNNSNLVAENLEALLNKQKDLNELLNNSHQTINSQHSGILSYKIDGYEEILKPQDFQNYNYNAIDFNKIKTNIEEIDEAENTTGGSSLFKIIDDHEWHIALKIEDEKILEFEEGKIYNIQLNGEDTLKGKIIAINVDDSKGVIVIEFKERLHGFYNNRIMDLSLITSQTNSFEIPTSTIIEKEGQAGVYINEIYGIVKFVPVNILYEEDDITYIEQGNNDAYITIEGEEVRTITKFDEIFLNPSSLEENEILR